MPTEITNKQDAGCTCENALCGRDGKPYTRYAPKQGKHIQEQGCKRERVGVNNEYGITRLLHCVEKGRCEPRDSHHGQGDAGDQE